MKQFIHKRSPSAPKKFFSWVHFDKWAFFRGLKSGSFSAIESSLLWALKAAVLDAVTSKGYPSARLYVEEQDTGFVEVRIDPMGAGAGREIIAHEPTFADCCEVLAPQLNKLVLKAS